MASTQHYSSGATVDASGSAEVDFQPATGYVWQVTNISVNNSGLGAPTCSVYLNSTFICGTNIGLGDSADGSSVPVRPGDTLKLVWTGATPGSQSAAVIIVQESTVGSGLV